MDFHEQYHSMNERIAPDDALVTATLARMEGARRPHRARRTVRVVIAVAAALACVTTALAANQEAVLRVLYQLAPGVAAYMQPVNLVSEEQGIRMEVVSADVDGSEAGVYLTLTDLEGGRFGDTAPDLFDSWSLEYPNRWSAPRALSCSALDYDEATRTATYYLRITDLGGDIPSGAFRFSFRKLLVGKEELTGVPVTADLSAVPQDAATERHDVNGLSTSDPTLYETMQEYDFLAPQGTLWQSEDGNFSLAAAGWRDGALHLLYRTDGALSRDNHAFFSPVRLADGTEVESDYSVSYNDFDADTSYYEYVFPMPYEAVSGCSLSGDLYTSAGLINGDWSVSFRLSE